MCSQFKCGTLEEDTGRGIINPRAGWLNVFPIPFKNSYCYGSTGRLSLGQFHDIIASLKNFSVEETERAWLLSSSQRRYPPQNQCETQMILSLKICIWFLPLLEVAVSFCLLFPTCF